MCATSTLVCLVACILSLACNSYSYVTGHQHSSMSLSQNVQKYAVGALPDITFKMPTSWAGQIQVPATDNDELFFWLFQAEQPSNDLISKYRCHQTLKFADPGFSLVEWWPGLFFT